MNNKNVTLQYSFLQVSFWMGFSSISAFASVYLLDLGISNRTIGLIISLGALFSALIQPLVGNMIDNNVNFTTRKVLGIAAACAVIIAMLLYPISRISTILISVFYGLLILIIQLGQPFTNALGMASQNAGQKLLFGPARAMGSLGYAVIAYVLGILTANKGPHVVPVCIAVIFLIHFLSIIIYPLNEKAGKEEFLNNRASENDNSSKSTSLAGFLLKYKSFSVMLIGLVLIYFSHVVINSFSLQIITPRGGSSADMGLATAFSAGIELIPMFLFPLIRKKVKINNMLRVSVIFFTLKVLFTYLAGSVTAYILVQSFQMLGWGIMAVAIVYFVKDNIDEHEQAQGQAFAGMSLTIGNVIGGFFGGIIIDAFSVDTLLITGLISAALGSLIFWIGIASGEKSKESASM